MNCSVILIKQLFVSNAISKQVKKDLKFWVSFTKSNLPKTKYVKTISGFYPLGQAEYGSKF